MTGMLKRIPFNRMTPVGSEEEYVARSLRSGHLSASGPFTRLCEAELRKMTGTEAVLLTTSATDALEIAVRLLDLAPGDEVIMPSYTFVSTANAVCLAGGRPRFVDIDPETLNLDPDAVEAAIGPRTAAIIPVHYAGVACDMDRIVAIAEGAGIPVIEDAAHAICATYRGRPLGTLGALGVFSFHETKNIGCGEGGALLVNDPALAERAMILRDKGTNRRAFNEGLVDKYTWVDIGSSHGLADNLAAFLLGQLEQADHITARRLEICRRYADAFRGLENAGHCRGPIVPAECGPNGHMFHLLLGSPKDRPALLSELQSRQIQATFHYVPLHLSPMGRSHGYDQGDLPVTEALADRVVRLPVYFDLSQEDQDRVISAVLSFFASPPDPPDQTAGGTEIL